MIYWWVMNWITDSTIAQYENSKTDRFRKHAAKSVGRSFALLWSCQAVNCLHLWTWSQQLFNQHFTNESRRTSDEDDFISIIFRNSCHSGAEMAECNHVPYRCPPVKLKTMLFPRRSGQPFRNRLFPRRSPDQINQTEMPKHEPYVDSRSTYPPVDSCRPTPLWMALDL